MDATANDATFECISADILRDFNSGRLQDAALEEQVAEHLGACSECESRLSSLPRNTIEELLRETDPIQSLIDAGQLSIDQSLASTRSCVKIQTDGSKVVHVVPPTDGLPVKIDQYFVIRKLGSGGFGEVFLARDPQHNRLVAIKLPRPGRLATLEVREAFLAEARTVAVLDNSNIVPLYDCRELVDGRCIVVMKYIKGCTLQDLMRVERFDHQRSAILVAKIARALHEAHKRSIWHRDVKPANILLDEEGNPYLADFGLALHEDQQHLHANELAGTYPYMSPEQINGGAARLDGRTDIWSLGVVFYELLCRRRPFPAKGEALAGEICEREPKPPRLSDDRIPRELERITLKCLSKEIHQRYATARDLAEDLEHWLALGSEFAEKTTSAEEPVGNRSPGAMTSHLHRPAISRHQRLMRWPLFGIALVLCALAISAAVMYNRNAGDFGSLGRIPRTFSRPNHTYALLDREPVPVVVPDASLLHAVSFNSPAQTLSIQSADPCFHSFGVVPNEQYAIRVGIQKPSHDGACGLFFGFRPELGTKRDGEFWTCHVLLLVCYKRSAADLVTRLERHHMRFQALDSGLHLVLDDAAPAQAVVAPPGNGTGLLEVEVRNDHIRIIRWNNQELAELSSAAIAFQDDKWSCRGQFGVVNLYGSAVFSLSQLVVH